MSWSTTLRIDVIEPYSGSILIGMSSRHSGRAPQVSGLRSQRILSS
jgi:hypothetical protein